MLLPKIFLVFVGLVVLVDAQRTTTSSWNTEENLANSFTRQQLRLGMQETCQSTGVVYRQGRSFTSVKSDGATYRCRCYHSDCVRIICSRTTEPTSAPLTTPAIISGEEGEDEIGGEVPEDSSNGNRPGDSNSIVVPEFKPISTDGQHRGSRRRSCSLPSDPVRVGVATYNYIGGCYDKWNDMEYRSGTTYNRTRSFGRSVTGTYTCTCSSSMMRCSLIDGPCCDLESGTYVGLNEPFVTSHLGREMKCRCLRQRMRYGYCTSLSGDESGGSTINYRQRPSGGSTGIARYRNRYRYPHYRVPTSSTRFSTTCYDEATNRSYAVGKSVGSCVCRRAGGTTRWVCQ